MRFNVTNRFNMHTTPRRNKRKHMNSLIGKVLESEAKIPTWAYTFLTKRKGSIYIETDCQ